LKITDFGFAKKMMNNRQLTGTTLGTPFYMAPQLLKGLKYSSKCDVWSIGVIYYELLFGTHPWKGNSIHQLASHIQNEALFFDPSVKIS
jgi:serine/threonine protein kinase